MHQDVLRLFFIDPIPKQDIWHWGDPSDQQHCTLAHTITVVTIVYLMVTILYLVIAILYLIVPILYLVVTLERREGLRSLNWLWVSHPLDCLPR